MQENALFFTTETNPNTLMKEMDNAIQYSQDLQQSLENLFQRGMHIDQTDYEGRTALMWAVVKGKIDLVRWLLEQNANINIFFMFQGHFPKTALDAAIDTRRDSIKEFLIQKGAKTGKGNEQRKHFVVTIRRCPHLLHVTSYLLHDLTLLPPKEYLQDIVPQN